jgi:Holliday junction resolvase RusA-like endonuclease
MEWCLKLPWPPSVNHYKKVGRIVKTKSGKLYQQRVNTNETTTFYYQVYMLAKNHIPPGWAEMAGSDTIRYFLKVSLHSPNNYRYDIDNQLKVLLDGLVRAHVIKDDAQICRLYVEKMDTIEQGQVIVRIQGFE